MDATRIKVYLPLVLPILCDFAELAYDSSKCSKLNAMLDEALLAESCCCLLLPGAEYEGDSFHLAFFLCFVE